MFKFVIDKLEDVADELRKYYKQRADGKFQLEVDGAEGAEDVAGLKSALAKEKEDALALKQKLDGLNKGELAELKRLKKEREDADRKKLEEDGNFEAVKQQMITKHAEELAAKDKRIDAYMKQIRTLMVDNEATKAIVEAKGNPKLLAPIVRSALELRETDDGAFSVVVRNPDGTPMVSDAKGTPTSILQYVETLKAVPDYQPAFSSTGSNGGGALPLGGGTGDPSNQPLSKWTPEQKRAFIREKGTDAYRDVVAKQA